MTFSADEDAAISLCRMTYEGDCRCEKNGRVICVPMIRDIESMRPHLEKMRKAFASQSSNDEAKP